MMSNALRVRTYNNKTALTDSSPLSFLKGVLSGSRLCHKVKIRIHLARGHRLLNSGYWSAYAGFTVNTNGIAIRKTYSPYCST